MRSNGAWLLVILALVGIAAGFSSRASTPSGEVSPFQMVTATGHFFPSIDLPPMAGLLPSDKGYAEVRKLTNPYRTDGGAAFEGQQLFRSNCAFCHGPNGLGDGPAGMSLNPKPNDLTRVKSYQHGPGDVGIFRAIKFGVDGTAMAPWEGRMTDDETWKVTHTCAAFSSRARGRDLKKDLREAPADS